MFKAHFAFVTQDNFWLDKLKIALRVTAVNNVIN
jgi:hypothetical protein